MDNQNAKAISTNIVLLGLVSFLNDFSSDLIIPILPMFIASLGGTGLVIGLIGGIQESAVSLLKVICGFWSDRIGKRKAFVLSGYTISALFKICLSFSRIWYHVLAFSGLERSGKGIRTAPRDAIIADSMPLNRGKGFGFHRAMDNAGGILGSIMLVILIRYLHLGYKQIIIISALLGFLALLPLIKVKEKNRDPLRVSFQMSFAGLSHSLRLFLVVSALFALANFSYMFFILRAFELFSRGEVSSGIAITPILLYVLFNIFNVSFSIPFGILSDRIGRKKVIISGYLLFSFVCLGFALFESLAMFLLLFALYGVVRAILDGNQRAFVSDLSRQDSRATALGFYHSTIGILCLPSSLIAGFLYQAFSPNVAFLYGFLLSVLAVLVLLLCRRRIQERPHITANQ